MNAASHTPIGSAEVDVFKGADSALARRVSSTADGHFRVQALEPGRYRVRVRALG